MITVIDEAKETLKKKDKEALENLCALLRAVEIWYESNNVPVAEMTKAVHIFAQKTLDIMYMKLRPYIYHIVFKKTNTDYILDVLSEKIELKKKW